MRPRVRTGYAVLGFVRPDLHAMAATKTSPPLGAHGVEGVRL